MKADTIGKIFSYYLNNEEFSSEIERAKNEFFDIKRGNFLITVDSKYMPLFMEYLAFDFKLKNGQSLIEHYYSKNPQKLPAYKLRVYKDLLENVFGLLEAKKINLGKSLEVLMLNTGKSYLVYEHNATYDLKPGHIFFGRVAKINNVYKLVGSDSFIFNIGLDNNLRRRLRTKEKLTPKTVLEHLRAVKESPNINNIDIAKKDVKQIKKDFNTLLKEIGQAKMISADLVQKWLSEVDFKEDYRSVLNIVYALSDMKLLNDDRLNSLIELTTDLVNYSPRLSLGGKSSIDLYDKKTFGSEGSNLSLKKLGGECLDQANQAMEHLKKNNIHKAFKLYEKTFKTLCREETSSRFVSSIFANTAVCYLHFGSLHMAKKLLETALEIKPNYKFAKGLLQEINDKKHDIYVAKQIRQGLKTNFIKGDYLYKFKKISKNYSDIKLLREYNKISKPIVEKLWEKSDYNKYYKFLKKLNINFNDV